MFFTLLLACTSPKFQDTSHPNTANLIMTTVAMDYSVGALASFDTDSDTLTENISSVSGDPVVVSDGGWIWQLNRYQYDTIRKYDPSNLQVPLAEVSLAPDVGSSNPHDVAICGTSLVVSLYGQDYLALLDPNTLALTGQIDIGSFADDDGIPEASSMVRVEDSLLVGLQRLNRSAGFTPETSTILVIDCNTHTVTDSVFTGQNIHLFEWGDTVAYVTESTTDTSSTVYVFEDEAWQAVHTSPERISSIDYGDNTLFYSTLSADQLSYQLHCLDLESDTLQSSTVISEYITDLVIEDASTGWVGAHWGWSDVSSAEPGLYRLDLDTCSVMTHWDMALAPFSMVLH